MTSQLPQLVEFQAIRSELLGHFPIEERGAIIECLDIFIDCENVYGAFRLSRKNDNRLYAIHEEKLRIIPEYTNNNQNRVLKYLKQFRGSISKALNHGSGMFLPWKPYEVIPMLRKPPRSKAPSDSREQLQIAKPANSRFVVCGFCGVSIAKGGALKKHVENTHDMPYEVYKSSI